METYDGDIPSFLNQMKASDRSVAQNVDALDYSGKPKKDVLHVYHKFPLPVHQFMAHKFSME